MPFGICNTPPFKLTEAVLNSLLWQAYFVSLNDISVFYVTFWPTVATAYLAALGWVT